MPEVKKMSNVTKRSGDKEPFNAEKIRKSIRKAAVDAGVSEEVMKDEIEHVANDAIEMSKKKSGIKTGMIRNSILNQLDDVQPSVSESWRKFDSKYKAESI